MSVTLLTISFFIENVFLSVLDGLLPFIIIFYGLVKRKKFPIYYYTTCLSALYPIFWLMFINNCDYSKETAEIYSNSVVSAITICVIMTIFVAMFLLSVAPHGITVNKTMVRKIETIFRLDELILFLSILAILGALFLNLNVICDKPHKTEWVYLQDIIYTRHNANVFYKKANCDKQFEINAKHNKIIYTYDWREDWLYTDQNGNEVFQIEYGNGAFGIPWRRIVGNE